MSGMHRRGRRVALFGALTAALVLGLGGLAQGAPGDATATQVADINPGGSSSNSNPTELFNAGGTLLFQAIDPTNGDELWKSNGGPLGPGGTEMVTNIASGSGGSNPAQLTDVGGTVYFSATDGSGPADHGNELWKIASPFAAPTMVADINTTGGVSSSPEDLTNAGGTLLFAADDGSTGTEPWASNGTGGGTHLVKDVNPSGCSCPDGVAAIGTTYFFSADDGSSGYEVWKTTPPYDAGHTSMVRNINTAATTGSNPDQFTDVNGTLFFAADDGSGYELWKSTPPYDTGNTSMVKDINTSGASNPTDPVEVGSTLFFHAHDASADFELWKSVPPYSSASTTEIEVNPTGSSDPSQLANIGGTLYFAAGDGVHADELWRSNGGAVGAGTNLVADINPSGSSSPAELTDVGGQVFFRANDGTTGVELWKSAGSGATRVADLNPGMPSSNPQFMTNVNGTLFFRANDGLTGNELWKATIEPTPPPTGTSPAPAPTTPVAPKKKCKKKHKKHAAAAKKKCKKKKK